MKFIDPKSLQIASYGPQPRPLRVKEGKLCHIRFLLVGARHIVKDEQHSGVIWKF